MFLLSELAETFGSIAEQKAPVNMLRWCSNVFAALAVMIFKILFHVLQLRVKKMRLYYIYIYGMERFLFMKKCPDYCFTFGFFASGPHFFFIKGVPRCESKKNRFFLAYSVTKLSVNIPTKFQLWIPSISEDIARNSRTCRPLVG